MVDRHGKDESNVTCGFDIGSHNWILRIGEWYGNISDGVVIHERFDSLLSQAR